MTSFFTFFAGDRRKQMCRNILFNYFSSVPLMPDSAATNEHFRSRQAQMCRIFFSISFLLFFLRQIVWRLTGKRSQTLLFYLPVGNLMELFVRHHKTILDREASGRSAHFLSGESQVSPNQFLTIFFSAKNTISGKKFQTKVVLHKITFKMISRTAI